MSYFGPTVKKLVAYDDEWEREEIRSSESAMQNFVSDRIRLEFDDSRTIGVKFLISEGDEEPEETIWYLNPLYSNARKVNCKLASEIVPEIIFLPHNIEWLLERYDAFYHKLMRENQTYLCDEKKYNAFIEFLQTEK